MKGTIVLCLQEMVNNRYGERIWEETLKNAGVKTPRMFLPFENVADTTVLNIVKAACERLSLSLPQIANEFGNYWVMTYSQKTYPQYYTRHKTAKDFLLSLDALHIQMTKTMPDANPPHFTYEWKGENTLLMHYTSHRGLLDFAVGLAKGIGAFYREKLTVTKISPDKIQIVFQSS